VPLALIVDDNEKNRKLAKTLLDAAGFTTIAAADGAEAVAVAGENVPDVILMDLRLPDMGGEEALRTLREDPTTARIPVVAMSALSLEGSGDWLRAAGFAGSVSKPIDVRTFADQVRRFCD
jgi:two-component system cell cycle response regulator DivK